MNYYNDNDAKVCAWLRELIDANELPPGDVDERSILEIKPTDLAGYDQCHFFAGVGGWPLALRWAGLEGVRGIWTGSCPCQPLSCAGLGQGEKDERHLWPAFCNLIAKCSPPVVFGEQVASKDGREWFAGVRLDLEGMGYACGGADLCAASVGAPHRRQRIYWVAHADCARPAEQWRGRDEPEGFGAASYAGVLADAEHDAGRPDESGREAQGRGSDGRACEVAISTESGRATGRATAEDGRTPEQSGRCGSMCLGDAPRGGCGVGGDAAQPWRGGHADGTGGTGLSGMADTEYAERRAVESENVGHGSNAGRDETASGIGTRGATGGMGNATGNGCQVRPYLHGELRGQRLGKGCKPDNWSRFDILPCRDGKARRVESGTFPLVAGLPRGMVPSGDPSAQEAQATAEARVMRLRGYGNAIVPQVALEFINAWKES